MNVDTGLRGYRLHEGLHDWFGYDYQSGEIVMASSRRVVRRWLRAQMRYKEQCPSGGAWPYFQRLREGAAL